MIKIIAHDTTMDIPIFNSLYINKKKKIRSNQINFNKLNRLKLNKIDYKKYPSVKIIKNLPKNDSLFETALVSINDILVKKFLEKKINYNDIASKMSKMLKNPEINKLKKILPTHVSEVINTNENIFSKIKSLKI